MSRIDTLSATLTVAVVLSIGFFMYQSEPKHEQGVTQKVEAAPKGSTKTVLADRKQARQLPGEIRSKVAIKEKPASAVLISTTMNDPKPLIAETVTDSDPPDMPPNLDDVHFHFDRSGLSQETRTLLDHHVSVLQDPKWSVLLQGHTDQEGTIQQNLRVGLRRAETVKKYLIDQGVSPDRIQVVSFGEYQPICTQPNPECRHKNRRVRFALARRDFSKGQPPAVTASAQPSPLAPLKDWHTSDAATEIMTPAAIHEAEPPTTPDSKEELASSLASLKLSPSGKESVQPESGTHPTPIGPIIPEPVHSTPPPTVLPDGQNSATN